MKRLILAGAAILGIAGLTPAHAVLVATATVDGAPATGFTCTTTGGGGGINCSTTTQANFSLISLIGAGVPSLTAPDLSSLTLDATTNPLFAGGPHVLGITLTQTGINVPGPNSVTSTLTVNNLVGGPFGPTTESTSVNGSTIASFVFPATTITDTHTFVNNIPGAITSDAHTYLITFTAAGQTATDTIQLVAAAPEPASLAILGTALLGLGMVVRKRRS
jgi:hypothetical protein